MTFRQLLAFYRLLSKLGLCFATYMAEGLCTNSGFSPVWYQDSLTTICTLSMEIDATFRRFYSG